MSYRCVHNMVNFGPLAADIGPIFWDTPANFNWYRLGSVTTRHVVVGAPAKLCGVEQRAPPTFGRAAITMGIGPRSSSFFLSLYLFFLA